MGSAPNEFEVISTLIDKGWIPLRQMAVLLNYKELRGIYSLQRGRNAIPTIRVGGIERVYHDDVVHALKTVRSNKQDNAQILLSLLATAKKERERKEKRNA